MTTNVKAPIIQSFDAQTLGDIIGNVASAAGFSPRIDPELAVIQVPYLNQSCSPIHILQELELKYNGLANFSDGYLSFTKRWTGEAVSGQSIGTFILGPEDFGPGGFSIKLTSQFAYSQVKAGWFDPETYTTKFVTSSTSLSYSPGCAFGLLVTGAAVSGMRVWSAGDAGVGLCDGGAALEERTGWGVRGSAPSVRSGASSGLP